MTADDRRETQARARGRQRPARARRRTAIGRDETPTGLLVALGRAAQPILDLSLSPQPLTLHTTLRLALSPRPRPAPPGSHAHGHLARNPVSLATLGLGPTPPSPLAPKGLPLHLPPSSRRPPSLQLALPRLMSQLLPPIFPDGHGPSCHSSRPGLGLWLMLTLPLLCLALASSPRSPPRSPASPTEPVPPGTTQEEIDQARQMKQFTKYMGYGMESCVFKGSMAGVMGCVIPLSPAPFRPSVPCGRARSARAGHAALDGFARGSGADPTSLDDSRPHYPQCGPTDALAVPRTRARAGGRALASRTAGPSPRAGLGRAWGWLGCATRRACWPKRTRGHGG